jgi:archaellin
VEPVFWVVLVAVVLLAALAAAVVVAVALPHLRSGAQVLTPEGERVVREARARLTNSGRQ